MDQENEHRTDGERLGDLPEPDSSWEDLETGKPGQLSLATPFPTVAEHAFLVVARKWNVDVQAADKNISLPRAVDILALSCLLLAVEWGDKFTDVARQQMESNRGAAAARGYQSWYDRLPWELCQASMMVTPSESVAVKKLTVNLDNHSGSIRCWMMEIGWMARSWLAAPEAIPLLLKNLADTLGGPFKAAGLAAALVSTPDEFWTLARDFKHHDDRFAEQYAHRLKLLEVHGIFDIQASFWKLEAQCRKEIAAGVLGLQLVPPGRAALALKGHPEATNKKIALLSKARPEEAHQVARGKVDRPSKLTATPPDLVRLLEEEWVKKSPDLPLQPLPKKEAPATPVEPVEPGPEDAEKPSQEKVLPSDPKARKAVADRLVKLFQERNPGVRVDPGTPLGPEPLPENPTWSDEAEALEKSRDWPGLLAHCRQWTRAEADTVAAWYALGFAYANLGRHQEAIEALREGLRFWPDNDYIWYALGFAYTNSGNRSAALEAVRHLRSLDPQKADKLFNFIMNTPAPEKPVICPAPPMGLSGSTVPEVQRTVPETPKPAPAEPKPVPETPKPVPKIFEGIELPTAETAAKMTDADIEAKIDELIAAGVAPTDYLLEESDRPAAPGPLAATDEKVAPAVSDMKAVAREEAKSRG